MDETYFEDNFNPEEMNALGIYPWVWGQGYCDYESILGEYQQLKRFFQKAANEQNYVLAYVG